MKTFGKQIVSLLFTGVLLTSCAWQNQKESVKETPKIPVKEQNTEVEPVKGRLDVYSSMARTTKYNTGETYKNLSEILNQRSQQESAQDLMEYLNQKFENNSLINASQKLDFVILYASVRLSEDPVFMHDYIYNHSAQQIALATIKGQSEALFAQRKQKEIARQIAQTEKNILSLKQKLAKKGALNTEDLEYQKSLEVSLYQLKQLQNDLNEAWINFAAFVKTSPKSLHVEGKHFYELEDFDQKNKLDTFQQVALSNRVEFDLARKEILGFNSFYLYDKTLQNYPALKRLEINGFGVENDIYQQELINDANLIAQTLLKDVDDYRKLQNSEQKNAMRRNVMNNLGAAVLTQMTIDYALVDLTSLDYEQAKNKVRDLREQIRQEERLKKHSKEQLAQLLKKRLELHQQEKFLNQIQAERAVALRSLYFHSGLSVFSEELLSKNLETIEASLKKAFNKDMIEMLAQAKDLQKRKKTQGNTWAKSENWLEELIDNKAKKEDAPIILPQKPSGDFSPYVGKVFDSFPIMQLGSYRQKVNADIEWQMLQELYPEFANVKPKVESSVVNGKMMYRLIVKSKNGGFLDVCNKLRQDKIECILRQK